MAGSVQGANGRRPQRLGRHPVTDEATTGTHAARCSTSSAFENTLHRVDGGGENPSSCRKPATAVAEELHWAGLPEEDLLEPLEEVVRMQDEDVGVEIEDDTQLPASSLGRVSANLPEDLSGRQSAEAEALERHTVFSTRVRAEALEQQKAVLELFFLLLLPCRLLFFLLINSHCGAGQSVGT